MNRAATLCIACLILAFAAPAAPESRGHAHNDYRHERPLLDALDRGFASVEADVFLVDGELLVAHDLRDVSPERTLEALYLAPLNDRVERHNGKVHPWLDQFVLLIDIKAGGEDVYRALKPLLEKYREMLTAVDNGVVTPGPVIAILSGDYPFETVAADESRLVAIDGRPRHLGEEHPVHLIPLISDNWHNHFKWTGSGPMPDDQRQALRDLVQRVHAEDRMLRFWATPDRPELWHEQVSAGVDLINADNLPRLEAFLMHGSNDN